MEDLEEAVEVLVVEEEVVVSEEDVEDHLEEVVEDLVEAGVDLEAEDDDKNDLNVLQIVFWMSQTVFLSAFVKRIKTFLH